MRFLTKFTGFTEYPLDDPDCSIQDVMIAFRNETK